MERPWYRSWPAGVPRTLDPPRATLAAMVAEHARTRGGAPAVNFYGAVWDYGRLDGLAARLALALARRGVSRGDRVCLFMENCPQFVIACLAAWRIGAVAVPANPMLKEEELAHLLRHSACETIILRDALYPVLHGTRRHVALKNVVVTRFADFLPEAPELPLHPSLGAPLCYFPHTYEFPALLAEEGEGTLHPAGLPDPALLLYTAGSTGVPKGAVITHANLAANVRCASLWYGGSNGVHLAVLPLCHATGLVGSLGLALFQGDPVVLLARYDTETVLQAVEKYRCTNWVSVPTMNVAVINYPGVENRKLDSLRVCTCGAAPVPFDLFERFGAVTGVALTEGYGLSETTSQLTINPCDRPRPGSVGIPVIDTDVRIVHPDDPRREVAPGETGELLARGPQVTGGYWNNPEENRRAFPDGWLATGDLARMDPDGYIHLAGRKKEVIKASGYSVFPAEVEAVLSRHPAVAEVAVTGVPDPYRGQNVKAWVVLKRDYVNTVSETDLIRWARGRMAAYKYPREICFCPELPKNGDGRIQRHLLGAPGTCG